MSTPNILNYVPKYMNQVVNTAPRGVITSDRWNELWNLIIDQGDYNAQTLKILCDSLANGMLTIEGDQIIFGPEASLSWGQLTEVPDLDQSALDAWAASNYATYIDGSGVYTGTVAANQLVIGGANGTISFNDLSDVPEVLDGKSVNWLGVFSDYPVAPEELDAFYHTGEGKSYVYTGVEWQIMAQDGAQGETGADGAPGADGADGVDAGRFNWLGEFASAPAEPVYLDAYHNTTDNTTYVYDGAVWQVLDTGYYMAPKWIFSTKIQGDSLETPLVLANFIQVGGSIAVGSGDGVAGISGADPEDDTAIRFWAGNAQPNLAPFRVTQGGDVIITGTNAQTVIDEYGVNPKFLDYSKNLIWNSGFEVYDSQNSNKPLFWAITGDGDSNADSSFSGSRSLRLGTAALARQVWAARIKPWWLGSPVIRVSFYANFVKDFKVRVVDIGTWVESGGVTIRYYTLTDADGNTGTELTFTGSNGWEDSRIGITFDSSEYTSDEITAPDTAFALEFENVDTGDVYIDGVMAHPDFTGSWAQIYKPGPKSLSFSDIGDAWSDSNPLEESTPTLSFQQIVVSDTAPTDTTKLWYDTSS